MSTSRDTIEFTADRGDAKLRLDQAITRRVTDVSGLSRSRAQAWIASGIVTVDGRVATRAASRVREGSTITVVLPETVQRRERPAPESAALDIIYQDDELMAINKPAGVVVHPSFRNSTGTLLNAVLGHLRDRAGANPGIVTRLDKDTSGLVLVATHARIHHAIQRDAAAGLVAKTYLAIVRGSPKPRRGVILLPLARDPDDRRRMKVTRAGAPSETRYEVIGTTDRHTIVSCELGTGRTHQIRVHFAAIGCPIAGDRLYGEPDPLLARQALHAWRLTFPHPVTRRELRLEAPLPPDLAAFFDDVTDHESTKATKHS